MNTLIAKVSLRLSGLAACVALFAVTSASAQTTVIYADDFSSSAGPLSGNTVQTSSGTLGGTLDATWAAESIFNYSGAPNDDLVANFGVGYAKLEFAPVDGYIYTFTVDMDPDNAASSNALAMGFSANMSTSDPASSTRAPWILYSRRGTGEAYSVGTTSIGTFGEDTGVSDPIRVTLVLNTTETAWSTSYSIENLSTSSVIGSGSYSYTTNPTIEAVFLRNANVSNGTFDNFQVTAAIPEPSYGALACGGAVLTLLWSSRQRRKNRI